MLLSNPANAIIVDGLGLGTINDNDSAQPTLSINDVSAGEAAGSIDFTVSLSATTSQEVTVDYASADSTAQAGSDYTGTSGTLTIPANTSSGTISVAITDDASSEPQEVFKLLLSNPTNATIADGLALGTINDNDIAPTLSIADASVNEDAGSIDFTVSLSATTSQEVTVDYASADSTALAGDDYTGTTGTLTIPANTPNGTISVPITDDALNEPQEVFKLLLSNPTNATIADGLALGTINDDDASSTTTFEVRIAADSDDAEESPSGSVDLTSSDLELVDDGGDQTVGLRFTAVNIPAGATITNAYVQFQADEASTEATNLTIEGQAADNPSAFTTSSSNVSSRPRTGAQASWSPPAWNTVGEAGSDQRTTNIAAVIQEIVSRPGWASGNALALIVTGTGKRVAESRRPGPATAPLLHVEYTSGGGGTPALSISDASVNEDAGNIDFTVSLSATTSQTVTVDYASADSTAQAGSDYSAASGTLTIPANTPSGTISVPITDDAASEPQEVFKMLLSNPANAIIVDGLGLGTINDNDSAQPTLSINDVSAGEAAGSIDFTVSLSATTSQEVTVDYASADSTAQAGSDYTGTSGTLTIPANTSSGTISVAITDDASSEPQEVFKLLLSNPTNATIADGLGLGTINDNEGPPTLTIDDRSAGEAAGTMTFTVSMSATSGQAVTVDYTTADSTALDGSDYTAVSGTLTIPADSASGAIPVPITDDALSEPSERFKLVLNNPANATIVDGLGVGTINDNDSAPTISVNDVSADEDAGTMTFDVTMSAVSGQTVTIDYATADSTAQAGSDYTAASGTLTIPIDSTGGTITVAIDDDASSESTEVFKLVLSNPTNATITDGLGVGTINDNDAGGQIVTITLQEGANGYAGTNDTQLDSTTPGTNFDTTDRLEMDGSPDVSSLIRWDMSSIPSGSNIQSVELTLYIRNGSPVLYDIYEMLRPWDESEANWTQYAAGQNWQIAGANGSEDRGTVPLGGITGSTGFKTFSLNSAGIGVVQSWVDNPSSNHGFVFLDYDEGSNGLAFFSSDRSTVEHRPQLTVTYSKGGTTGMQAAKATPAALMGMQDEAGYIEEELPESVALNPNYPNPFSRETQIDYALPEQAHVRMEIYNVRGQLVRTLVDNIQDAGFQARTLERNRRRPAPGRFRHLPHQVNRRRATIYREDDPGEISK